MTLEERRIHNLFHTLWTKAVDTPDYNKTEWKQLDAVLQELMRPLRVRLVP